MKVPTKQPKRGRLWLNDGSIVRLRPEFPKHVWSYDFMEDRTHNGVKFRILNIIDEYTRECLAVRVGRSLTHRDVLEVLSELFCERGVPVHLRSDNGSEFTARRVQAWLKRLDVRPLFIEPGSPWENGYIESFNGKMRDELLAREIFYSLKEAQVMIEMWRQQYNTIRPHSALPSTACTRCNHAAAFQFQLSDYIKLVQIMGRSVFLSKRRVYYIVDIFPESAWKDRTNFLNQQHASLQNITA
jgi:transposase InsO family protein